MPVCIAGMHRSGTSMVANLLHQSGLYLGSEADLIPPTPDNPEGHWENSRFTTINEQILREHQATWYSPPPADQDWNTQPIVEISRRATALLEEFSGHEPWGWKDPRNCLTLPVWSSLLPDLKVVICLRNPLEVAFSLRRRPVFKYSTDNIRWRRLKEVRAALSLTRRRFFSLPACLRLWQTYNERILEATTHENRIITHYEKCLCDPRLELRRILRFLGMPALPEVVDESSANAMLSLRHNRFSTSDLKSAAVPSDVLDLYTRMCEEAGFNHELATPKIETATTG